MVYQNMYCWRASRTHQKEQTSIKQLPIFSEKENLFYGIIHVANMAKVCRYQSLGGFYCECNTIIMLYNTLG